MSIRDKERRQRYIKGIVFALAVHIGVGGALGFLGAWINPNTNQTIIEVSLAKPAAKKKAVAKKPKPVPIKPRKDDIIDKRLKPIPKEEPKPEPEEEPETNAEEGTTEGTAEGTGTSDGADDGANDGVAVQRPSVTYSYKPPYPSDSKAKGSEGTVRLKVLITEQGRVAEANVVGSSGDPSLDRAALNAIYKWRFSPARNAKKVAIPCYVNVPIAFRLK